MNSSTNQPLFAANVVVRQPDLLSRPHPQEDHHAHVPELPNAVQSPSSINQAERTTHPSLPRPPPRTPLVPSGSVSPGSPGPPDPPIAPALPVSPASPGAPGSHHSNKESQPATLLPKNEWRPWRLSCWFNATLLLTEMGFIVAIVVLDQLSVRNDGIVTLPTVEVSLSTLTLSAIFNIRQYYGLLWTSLPSFFVALYSLTWAAVVSASYERQPFIELIRGGDPRRTIMLDYRTYPVFYNWFLAFMHRHIHIGCAMLLNTVVSIAVVPLSSHLLVAAASTHGSSITLSYTSQYNDSLNIGTTNLQPFIDIATAVHAYRSLPPPWMTAEYAFASFSPSTSSFSGPSSANLSATTDAYSAHLDCQALDVGSYTVSYNDEGIEQGIDYGTATLQFRDRSCAIQQSLALSSDTAIYATSWYAICSGQTSNRFGMLTGTYASSSSSKLADISVISCIPSYWHSTGLLTVSANGPSPTTSNYIAFFEHNRTAMHNTVTEIFESTLPLYFFTNAAATTDANAVGSSILSAATTAAGKDAKAAMAPNAILEATKRVFMTIYAALAASDLLMPAESVTDGSGVLAEPVNRLFVARPIAYVIVAVLVMVLASHVALWVYSERHESMLSEEPVGLLGNAVLLEGSDVGKVLKKVKEKCGEDVRVSEALEKNFNVKGIKCVWDKPGRKIKVEGLAWN